MSSLIEYATLAASQPWAMHVDYLRNVINGLRLVAGEEASPWAATMKAPKVSGSIAILPVYGMIQQRGSAMLEWFGGTSTDQLGAVFSAAMRNDQIGGVLLDVDSPGGTIPGVEELSAKIHAARGTKPIVAISNSLNASAAYWISSAAERVFAAPSSDTGSIGVWTAHHDWSKADEMAGIATTIIQAGRFKTEANPWQPLDEEARLHMQARVDQHYADFLGAVARNRGISVGKVKKDFGEGRTLLAKDAAEAGMVDRIVTKDKLLSEMTGESTKHKSPRADEAGTAELCALWDAPAIEAEREEIVPQGGSVDVLRRRMALKQRQTECKS